MKKFLLILILLLMTYTLVTRFISYENPDRAGPAPSYPCIIGTTEIAEPKKDLYPCQLLEAINQSYLEEIKPIFAQKCLMCHGIAPRLPLYAKLPPAKWIVERDRREAKRDVNMTWNFPFRTKKGTRHALEEIAEQVEEKSMPPLIYQIMHWHSELTQAEREKILNWTANAQAELKGAGGIL